MKKLLLLLFGLFVVLLLVIWFWDWTNPKLPDLSIGSTDSQPTCSYIFMANLSVMPAM